MQNEWYFTREELAKGATPEEIKIELNVRRATCAFLQDTGMKLNLPQLTIATAIVFFHRFFAARRFTEYDRHTIATTCVFLAGKVEETPKKLRDIINASESLKYRDVVPPRKPLDEQSPEMLTLKEKILAHELIILQTLAFEMTIEHPYKYLLKFVMQISGDKTLAQTAWNFINDSLRTTLCLQHKPDMIAAAAIHLAAKFLKYTLPMEPPWYEVFNVKLEILQQIGNQILDLYDNNFDPIVAATNPNQNKRPQNSQSNSQNKHPKHSSNSNPNQSTEENHLPSTTKDTNQILENNTQSMEISQSLDPVIESSVIESQSTSQEDNHTLESTQSSNDGNTDTVNTIPDNQPTEQLNNDNTLQTVILNEDANHAVEELNGHTDQPVSEVPLNQSVIMAENSQSNQVSQELGNSSESMNTDSIELVDMQMG
eukprot:TRINITY_DN8535_c0_g1_i1.p1 TRINITY_DN8535_c0_g1~~TRINITY_DN8535_c0_g1_i1.p1  ORF type:complete len:456 (-),score=89.12 TRINITY_DN8535_c0_g1_i1:63-1346(-)